MESPVLRPQGHALRFVVAYLDVNGTRLFYEDTGPVAGGSEQTLVFSHGLLWSTEMFRAQIEHFGRNSRVIAYDQRGQGNSTRDEAGSTSIETVYEDAVALLESLDVGPVHFIGLSMGGFVGMRLAARRPDLVASLVLFDTSADVEDRRKLFRYGAFMLGVRWFGVRWLARPVMPTMFGRTFRKDPSRTAEREFWREQLCRNHRTIWRSVHGVLVRKAISHELPKISCPVMVVVGAEDVATPPAKAWAIHALIPQSSLVSIPLAGHSPPIEQPQAVIGVLESHLATA